MVSIKSGSLTLDGRLEEPLKGHTGVGIVLCHPHPLYGGNMDNNVIHAVSRALRERGIATLRFNFRGVGNSEGKHDNGRGEVHDAMAAVSFLAESKGIEKVGLMGYSFGGMVALAAAMQDKTVEVVAAVSPMAIPELDTSTLRIVISGTEDSFIPASEIMQEKGRITADGKGTVELIEGADHFWWGKESLSAQKVASFLANATRR